MKLILSMALVALIALPSCGGINLPCEVTQTCPDPVPTPTPVPVPTPEPTPTPIPSCPAILSPGQNAALEEVDQVNVFGGILNGVMRDLSGCSGGRCVIDMTRQKWHAQVTAAIRMRGMCGTQHEPNTDEIAIGASVTSILEGYHIYSERPNRPGTGTIVFAPQANRPSWRIFGVDPDPEPTPEPTPPPGVSCGLPDPSKEPAEFKLKKHNLDWDSTFRITSRQYCDQVCSPLDPDNCFTGRLRCPVRFEGDPSREACERLVIGDQKWWCNGQKIAHNENPAQARCRGLVRTCTSDEKTCAEADW